MTSLIAALSAIAVLTNHVRFRERIVWRAAFPSMSKA
jgi:hypothetical protein